MAERKVHPEVVHLLAVLAKSRVVLRLAVLVMAKRKVHPKVAHP
tara:strand:+ start:379 stop:510 length:132 start_codon:yes stop_codon:yes gene_type:complete